MVVLEKEKIIEVSNLTVRYKERDIIKSLKNGRYKRGIENISFDVLKGEIFSIIGLNGAGKTSSMKCLLNLINPDKGSIKIFGKKNIKGEDFGRIGYLPEISYYPKTMRLKDIMMYYSELYSIPKNERKDKINKILKELGLLDRMNDKLESFSKGMLQKVGLAQAMINDPEILFLDEPMSGLDPLARENVIELIKKMKAKGTTVFFNTHILTDVANIGDKIAIIHEGKLIEVLDMKKLREDNTYIIICDSKNEENKIEVKEEGLNNKIEELIRSGCAIKKVEEKEFSLKEYFIKSIEKGE